MEGVMMQSKTSQALAVRNEDGFIEVKTRKLKPFKRVGKIPIIRGVVAFVRSLIAGTKLIYESAEVAFPEDETPGSFGMGVATCLGLLLAIALFFVAPVYIVKGVAWLISLVVAGFEINEYLLTLIEGVLRLVIFILYLFLVSKMNDIKRTFMYHGAEHRTINCFEHGKELTVENVQAHSTRHNRCGTTFLFFVMIMSMLVITLATYIFSLVGLYDLIAGNAIKRVLFRLILLPLIAGCSYEMLQGLAKLPDNKFVSILRAPGLAMQKLSTFPPEDEMAEVAIVAFCTVMEMDKNPELQDRKFGEYPIAQMRTFIAKKLQETDAQSCEADWILCHVLQVKRNELSFHAPLDKAQYRAVMEIVNKRANKIPLDYILGKSEFYGLEINVSDSVLIPRMDTEILVEKALSYITDGDKVLDLMTGSGCIAKAIKVNSNAIVYASDISEKAIEIAKTNFDGEIILSDCLNEIDEVFDVIVSNPPYIKTEVIQSLDDEVKAQPILALDGGQDGLDAYRKIANSIRKNLSKNGVLLLEIGYDQGEEVSGIFASVFESVSVEKDLNGNDRVVVCKTLKD